jgi:hypothetical protein
MRSLTIPREVSVLAGGTHTKTVEDYGRIALEVSASVNCKDWQIVQAPFMQINARTTDFHHRVIIGDGVLSYSETTTLEIYGKCFEHTDQNELIRVGNQALRHFDVLGRSNHF